LQCLLKTPVTAIKSVCVKTDLDHGYRTPFMDNCLKKKCPPENRAGTFRLTQTKITAECPDT
jgi:hypothetical protein